MSEPTSDPLPISGRLAGIDYGTVRIGVALCDSDRILASPWETYRRRNAQADADFFRRLIREERIVGFVLGLPLHLDDRISEKALEVIAFADWLRHETGLPLAFHDERYTSVEAEHHLRSGGLTNKRRRDRRDQLAAQLILTAYLESGK